MAYEKPVLTVFYGLNLRMAGSNFLVEQLMVYKIALIALTLGYHCRTAKESLTIQMRATESLFMMLNVC